MDNFRTVWIQPCNCGRQMSCGNKPD